jgi:hypothetical protein
MFLLNKNIVHLIDDVFWNMGFKHETQIEKVIPIILITCIIYLMYIIENASHYTIYIHYFQVRVDLGIADHVWQDERDIIAESLDNLGDQFRPAMRAGWLNFIRNAYPDGDGVVAGPAVGIGPFTLPD